MKRLIYPLFVAGSMAVLCACQGQSNEEARQEYAAFTVKETSVETIDDYPAALRGRQDIEIYPQVSGKITQVAVTEGQRVRKGQTLFVIDQVPYLAALQTAKANVSAARAGAATARLTRDSKRELYAGRVISHYELSTAENALLTAEAQLEQALAQEVTARNDLSYTVVTSPADGVVGTIPYRIGALVSASSAQPLTTVSDNSEMYVYFSMPENRMLSLIRQYGTVERTLAEMPAVRLRLNDGTEYPVERRIESISGVIDPQTGSVSIRAAFLNPEGLLHSGGAGNLLIAQHTEEALTIPQAATYELQDKVYVYKVVDGHAVSAPVSVTPLNDRKAYLVHSGLRTGEVIVAEGIGLLQDGAAISIKKQN